jgi:dTMP kinase
MASDSSPAPVSQRRGVLIVFEGIDGAGKTSQMQSLKAWMQRLGVDSRWDREPTDGPHGRRLRESAMTGRLSPADELALFMADRRDHVRDVIEPALAGGQVVVLDRYYHSNAAYQGSRGLDWREILRSNESFAPRPDRVLWLDVDPAVSGERIRSRGEGTNQFERIDQLQRCREIYEAMADESFVRMDAARPVAAVEADVRAAVTQILTARGILITPPSADNPAA